MNATEKKLVRCAVYTRKSSEEGLELAFNSLQAQREAAEAYIASQKHEGWVCLPKHYDDGGFTGGNMERPALKDLLRDIENGLIDVVLTYKVDRLSRSLLDFALLMGTFDKSGVTFVSITQQFNSTTPMGRLTLNILLSFAQFEREIIGERIRDKIAASKKRGMHTGGRPILGYDSVGTKLKINSDEAKIVRHIFRRFLILRSALRLAHELNEQGISTKVWTSARGKAHTGHKWNKVSVYNLLNNRKYVGEVTHFDKVFPGEHEAIIDRKVWDQVQAVFRENSRVRSGQTRNRSPALLKGILQCGHCAGSMGITYTKKKGRVYRYYQCHAASKNGYETCPVRSVPAGNIEAAVVTQIRNILNTPEVLAKACQAINESEPPETAEAAMAILREVDTVWDSLFPQEQARICRLLLDKVTVNTDGLDVQLCRDGVHSLAAELQEDAEEGDGHVSRDGSVE